MLRINSRLCFQVHQGFELHIPLSSDNGLSNLVEQIKGFIKCHLFGRLLQRQYCRQNLRKPTLKMSESIKYTPSLSLTSMVHPKSLNSSVIKTMGSCLFHRLRPSVCVHQRDSQHSQALGNQVASCWFAFCCVVLVGFW